MRIVPPVAALVSLFSALGIVYALNGTPAPPAAPAPVVHSPPPHAVKASMPLIPPRWHVVR